MFSFSLLFLLFFFFYVLFLVCSEPVFVPGYRSLCAAVPHRPHRPSTSPSATSQDRFSHLLAAHVRVYLYIIVCTGIRYIYIHTRKHKSGDLVYGIRMCGPGQVYIMADTKNIDVVFSYCRRAAAVLQRNIDVSRLHSACTLLLLLLHHRTFVFCFRGGEVLLRLYI